MAGRCTISLGEPLDEAHRTFSAKGMEASHQARWATHVGVDVSRPAPALDAFGHQPMAKSWIVDQDARVQAVDCREPFGTPSIVDGGDMDMDDVVHLLFVRQDGGFIGNQGDLLCPSMRHAVEPQAAAPSMLDGQGAILKDPPKPTLEDARAVVPTCWSSLQVVGDRRGLVSDVVEVQQGVHEEGNPHLRVPRESFEIRPTPQVEAADVETCDLCYFYQSEASVGSKLPI